ncbi:hypothetical protein ACLMJK_006464 [Lecanora helva]
MKFSLTECVFAFPDYNITETYRQCSETCGGSDDSMRLAMTSQLLSTNLTSIYDYCSLMAGAFSKNVGACMHCLESVPSSHALINYLKALEETCAQQPRGGGPTPVKLDFDLYSNLPSSAAARNSRDAAIAAATRVAKTTQTILAAKTTIASSTALGAANTRIRLDLGFGIGFGGFGLLMATGAAILFTRRWPRKEVERMTGTAHGSKGAPQVHHTHRDSECITELSSSTAISQVDDGVRPALLEKDARWESQRQELANSEWPEMA